MLTHARIICVFIGVIGLSGCLTTKTNEYNNSQSYDYQPSPLYPDGYDNTVAYGNDVYSEPKEVVVPDSYHVSATRAPIASKDLDRGWVNSQNPMGYTIQLADDEKPARVAGLLQKAPKNERMAEVKYQHNGKAYYKGLYGTYTTQDDANKALNALPDEIKHGAGIKTWESVQQTVAD